MDDVAEAVSRATGTYLEHRNVDSHDLSRLIRREPTPLAAVIAAAARA
jgi:hypothetical protein